MRITGGAFRSRPLRAPRGDATRPTSDRVREALFSILLSRRELQGARVLDLWAGTGSLAFEALSRGAAHATLVESARPALDVIRANASELGVVDRVTIVGAPVARALRSLDGAFDVVFADPPYKDVAAAIPDVIGQLLRAARVASDAIVVVEHAKGDEPPVIEGASLADSRRYGDTTLSFYLPAA